MGVSGISRSGRLIVVAVTALVAAGCAAGAGWPGAASREAMQTRNWLDCAWWAGGAEEGATAVLWRRGDPPGGRSPEAGTCASCARVPGEFVLRRQQRGFLG